MKSNDFDPALIEREIRGRLSQREYQLLQARLTHACKAIETIRTRLPGEVAELLVQPVRASLRTLSDRHRTHLEWLVAEFCGANLDEPTIRKVERQLRLVIDRQNC